MEEIAFFDFDGTLFLKDSFIDFALFAVGKKNFLGALFFASPWLVGWKLGIISNSKAKEKLFSLLYKGIDYTRFTELCRLYADRIEQNTMPRMMEQLMRHQAVGHRVVIVSASVADWIRPWAERHGIEKVIATEAEINPVTNCLTGGFSTPNCYGEEKVRRLKTKFPYFDTFETWAYGDSKSDRFIIAATTHGIETI